MTKAAKTTLRDATLYSDGDAYILLKLPPDAITLAAGVVAETAQPFTALIADKDEVTLMLPETAFDKRMRRLRRSSTSAEVYRLITFDIELPLTLVGFMAFVSGALAEAGIPILTYASFSRDHVFVRETDFDAAMRTLGELLGV